MGRRRAMWAAALRQLRRSALTVNQPFSKLDESGLASSVALVVSSNTWHLLNNKEQPCSAPSSRMELRAWGLGYSLHRSLSTQSRTTTLRLTAVCCTMRLRRSLSVLGKDFAVPRISHRDSNDRDVRMIERGPALSTNVSSLPEGADFVVSCNFFGNQESISGLSTA